jgi:hypothetical protein
MHVPRSHSVCKRAFLPLRNQLAAVREKDVEAESASMVADETATSSDTSIRNCNGLEIVARGQPNLRPGWPQTSRLLNNEQLKRGGGKPSVGDLAGDFRLAHDGTQTVGRMGVSSQISHFESVNEITRAFVTDREVATLLAFESKLALAAGGLDDGWAFQFDNFRRRRLGSTAGNECGKAKSNEQQRCFHDCHNVNDRVGV